MQGGGWVQLSGLRSLQTPFILHKGPVATQYQEALAADFASKTK